jgi:hypothetical protein
MKNPTEQTLYILNSADVDRIDAAVGLLAQILHDLVKARVIRLSTEPHSPGSLYELEEAARLSQEGGQTDDDF